MKPEIVDEQKQDQKQDQKKKTVRTMARLRLLRRRSNHLWTSDSLPQPPQSAHPCHLTHSNIVTSNLTIFYSFLIVINSIMIVCSDMKFPSSFEDSTVSNTFLFSATLAPLETLLQMLSQLETLREVVNNPAVSLSGTR